MKRLFLILLTLIGLGFLVWSFAFDSGKTLSFSFGDAIEKTADRIVDGAAQILETSKTTVEKTVSAPPPLRNPLTGRGEALSIEGVLEWTNAHRADAGRPPLALNDTLNIVADAKLRDMFAEQYFAHISPDGTGPSDLVDDAGYDYLAVGENLALGTYDDDKDLVQAWMDSPGHRENLLASQFSEIGIAVGRGQFEGHTTWLAVQTFARPASDCTAPDETLSARITANKSKLETMTQDAKARLTEIETTPEPKNPKQVRDYNKKLYKYNNQVKLIDELVKTIQGQVTVYNDQVQTFNACVNN